MLRIVVSWLGFAPRIHFFASGIISVIASGLVRVAIHKFCGSKRGVYIEIVAEVCKEQGAYRWAWRNPKEPQKWGEKGITPRIHFLKNGF